MVATLRLFRINSAWCRPKSETATTRSSGKPVFFNPRFSHNSAAYIGSRARATPRGVATPRSGGLLTAFGTTGWYPLKCSVSEHRNDGVIVAFLQRSTAFLESIVHDCRFALREVVKVPHFTAAAVTTLALAIGVNAAVFTVTNAVLFKGFRDIDRSDRIVFIHSERNGQYSGVSYPDLEDWRALARSFTGIGAVADLKVTINDRNGLPDRFTATRITANGFQLLGRQPIIGRDFSASDEAPGATPVAILSYGFWKRRFGKDSSIIGRTLDINGGPPTTIIGVMPEGFSFPQNQELWLPLVPDSDLRRRDNRALWFAFGYRADGATRNSARAELETIGNRLARAYPETNRAEIPRPHTFAEFFIGPTAATIYGLAWAAVGFVLLIACANIANLMLARSSDRSRELSIRLSLGAGRSRIVRQLLIENLLLSAIGGFFGWWIAKWSLRAYELATNPALGEWRRDLLDYTMDLHIFLYVVAISTGTSLLFGFAPLVHFAKLDLNASLKDWGPGATDSRSGKTFSRLLVIGEVSLAVMLMTGAGLMFRSFRNIYRANVGARTSDVRTMFLHLPEGEINSERQVSFFDQLKVRLEAIPGVQSVAMGNPPASGIPEGRPYEVAGTAAGSDGSNQPTAPATTIGPDYFKTIGATVLSGREFNQFDGRSGPPVVIVNQQFATQHWKTRNAIGQRLRLFNKGTPGMWLTVIGVVSNIMDDPSRQKITPMIYVPYAQTRGRDMWILIRTPLAAGELARVFRQEIAALDPSVPIWLGPYNLEDRLATVGIYSNIRNHSALFVIFALIALGLASSGLYAVIAHTVNQRSQEIGIRMAVGATPGNIAKLMFKVGLLPAGCGLVLGVAASAAVNQLLSSELLNVTPSDPVTLIVSCAVLMLSAIVACWIPARRAIRINPAVALRR